MNNTLTTPILGYDTDLNISLYRMLTSMINKLGAELNCNLHRSSGVGQFKRNRGAVKDIEFMYYYNNHLNFIRQMPYKMLSILNSKWVIDFITLFTKENPSNRYLTRIFHLNISPYKSSFFC